MHENILFDPTNYFELSKITTSVSTGEDRAGHETISYFLLSFTHFSFISYSFPPFFGFIYLLHLPSFFLLSYQLPPSSFHLISPPHAAPPPRGYKLTALPEETTDSFWFQVKLADGLSVSLPFIKQQSTPLPLPLSLSSVLFISPSVTFFPTPINLRTHSVNSVCIHGV